MKDPSAAVKPANKFGSYIFGSIIEGLDTGTTSGKALFNSKDKPWFIDALVPTILRKPIKVKCSLYYIIWNICLNNW